MIWNSLGVLTAILVVAGVDPKVDMPKKAKESLQRIWGLKMAEPKESVPAGLMMKQLIFESDRYTYIDDNNESGKGAYRVDPTKTPKALDLMPAQGPHKGKKIEAIYDLKDDTLRICIAKPGTKRPSDFTAKPESGRVLLTYMPGNL